MGNLLQKLIYNLSTTAPICFIFALVWYLQNKTTEIPVVFCITGIALIVCFSLSFRYGKKNIPPITIRINDIAPNDGWMAAYIITYLVPFASVVIENFNVVVSVVIAVMLAVAAPCINTAVPHPLLFICGYHFYRPGAGQGVSGYVLISKRRIRRAKDVRSVKRIFEFLLLDTEEK